MRKAEPLTMERFNSIVTNDLDDFERQLRDQGPAFTLRMTACVLVGIGCLIWLSLWHARNGNIGATCATTVGYLLAFSISGMATGWCLVDRDQWTNGRVLTLSLSIAAFAVAAFDFCGEMISTVHVPAFGHVAPALVPSLLFVPSMALGWACELRERRLRAGLGAEPTAGSSSAGDGSGGQRNPTQGPVHLTVEANMCSMDEGPVRGRAAGPPPAQQDRHGE